MKYPVLPLSVELQILDLILSEAFPMPKFFQLGLQHRIYSCKQCKLSCPIHSEEHTQCLKCQLQNTHSQCLWFPQTIFVKDLQLSLVVLILSAYIELTHAHVCVSACMCAWGVGVGGRNQTVVVVGIWLLSVTWFCCVLGVVLPLGLSYIHHSKRGHIPYIDRKKKDVSEKWD